MKVDYKDPLYDESDGSTNYDLRCDPVRKGERIVLQRVAAIDETTAYTSLKLGVGGHGEPYWYAEEKSPAVNEWYWDDQEIHLIEGEFLVARFNGTTTSDKLRLHLFGYREERGPPRG